MQTPDKQQIERSLNALVDPYTAKGLLDSGWVRGIGVAEQQISVDLRFGYRQQPEADWSAQIRAALLDLDQVDAAVVNVTRKVAVHQVQAKLKPQPQIKNIIAVASGKGGVGKSTTAVNLALGLAADGARVGILDADIYGPSIPTLLGLSGKPDTDGKMLEPKLKHGLQVMSIGFLVEEDTPMIWRGPMVTSALQQLLGETRWQDLDYLIVDLPPGTGDIQLTMAQKIPVAGAVIVTTPQDVALLDAKRALQMFNRVGVATLGVVENMSVYHCPQCGYEAHIFGRHGGQQMADDFALPVLGQIPLDIAIRQQSDAGEPPVLRADGVAEVYREMARSVAANLGMQAKSLQLNVPNIVLDTSSGLS